MHFLIYCFFVFFCFQPSGWAESKIQKEAPYPFFDNNPYLNPEMKKAMRPFLIPLDHPMRQVLDAIFTSSRVTQDEFTLAAAGFSTLSSRPRTFLKVVRNAALPGYLLKLQLDSELRRKEGKPTWRWLVNRCQGAENIRALIKRDKLQYFTVPKKWLYPLPEDPSPPKGEGFIRQVVVLVVEEMDVVDHDASVKAWKEAVTYRIVDELFWIIAHGYASSCIDINIPYCHDGTFSCIDTEHPKRTPDFGRVRHHLSDEMRDYWDYLVHQFSGKF